MISARLDLMPRKARENCFEFTVGAKLVSTLIFKISVRWKHCHISEVCQVKIGTWTVWSILTCHRIDRHQMGTARYSSWVVSVWCRSWLDFTWLPAGAHKSRLVLTVATPPLPTTSTPLEIFVQRLFWVRLWPHHSSKGTLLEEERKEGFPRQGCKQTEGRSASSF